MTPTKSRALYENLLDLGHAQGVSVFSAAILKKLSAPKTSITHLRIIASRFAAAGKLIRLARGLYALPRSLPKEEEIMQALDPAAYISLESVLNSASVLQQGIAVLTCVTPNRDRRFDIPLRSAGGRAQIQFHHLDKRFFEFGIRNGYEMEPEKALLDLIHIRLFSRRPPMPGGSWNVERLNRKKLESHAKKYPPPVRNFLQKFLSSEKSMKHSV